MSKYLTINIILNEIYNKLLSVQKTMMSLIERQDICIKKITDNKLEELQSKCGINNTDCTITQDEKFYKIEFFSFSLLKDNTLKSYKRKFFVNAKDEKEAIIKWQNHHYTTDVELIKVNEVKNKLDLGDLK